MFRLIGAFLISAAAFLCGAVQASAGSTCSLDPADAAISYSDSSTDYTFVVQDLGSGSYSICYDPGYPEYDPYTLPYDSGTFSEPAVADVNRDGWLDLLAGTQSATEGEVDLFLNDGTGSGIVVLDSTRPTGASVGPFLVHAADLNGDKWPDILTANGTDGTVSVILNDGSGGFAASKLYTVGKDITSLTAVDLNGDTYPDLVAEDPEGSAVEVLLNKGTGEFDAPASITVGQYPHHLAVTDLNKDGYPDIVTGNYGFDLADTVSVLINNGDGTFAAPATYDAVQLSNLMSIVDINGDTYPDIVVNYRTSSGYTELLVLLSKGDGTFSPATWIPSPDGASTSSGGVTLSGGSGTVLSGSTSTAVVTAVDPVTSTSSGSSVVLASTGNVSTQGGSPTASTSTNSSATTGSSTTTSSTTSGSTSNNSATSSPTAGTSTGATSTSNSSSTGPGGGGIMGWFSLLALGFAGARRKRSA